MKLNKKQKLVAEALYKGECREEEIAEKYGVPVSRLHLWLEQDDFKAELGRLCQASLRETRFTIARYGPIAALRLAELLGSEKEDTARRAALDMIDRSLKTHEGDSSDGEGATDSEESQLTDDQVRQMLLKLAEGLEE